MKIQRQFNSKYKGTPSNIEFEKSKTVPDLNLSVRELIHRHTRGIGIKEAYKQGFYFDTIIPQINDINDIYERKAALRKWQNELDKEVRSAREQNRKPDIQKVVDKQPVPTSTEQTDNGSGENINTNKTKS